MQYIIGNGEKKNYRPFTSKFKELCGLVWIFYKCNFFDEYSYFRNIYSV